MPPPPVAFADALILTGPTGSGKSAVALELAGRIGAEIVSMDSMTLYRGMDIGTAKPSAQEQAQVRHHLIDVLDPSESANVAWWLDCAATACADIRNRGKRPLFVGGTLFYLKALLCGLFDAPPADQALRRRLEAEAEQIGPLALHNRLRAVDPTAAGRLHPNDVRRVVRALEVWELTGKPISSFQHSWDTPTFAGEQGEPAHSLPCVVLEWPREELYRRIDARVDDMIAAGWLDEVRRLQDQPLSKEALQALGYRQLMDYLNGKQVWDEIIAQIKMRTRQFAKRQLTWFRNLPGCQTCPTDQADVAVRVLDSWANVRSNSF